MLMRAKEDKELSGMIKDKYSKYRVYIYEIKSNHFIPIDFHILNFFLIYFKLC